MAICSNCGHELKENESFCTSCGAQRGQVISPPPPPQQSSAPPVGSGSQNQAPVPPQGTPPPGTGFTPQTPPPGYEGGKKKGLPRGAKIAIIAGLIIVLLIGGTIAVGVLVVWNVVTGPADAANAFVEAVNEGDLSTAYKYFSSEAQKEEEKSDFDEQFKVLENELDTWNTTSVNVENNTAKVMMDLKSKDGEEATWEMNLVKQDGEWKILNIYFNSE
ncbi:MAG: zinc ribbon domain-containing protein [Actinobacteria bacterium]|nr:zinc ribbon domain-containing protein [Actinomycetota bacterium]